MRVREGPGHMIVKYSDGKPRWVPQRSVAFSYTFDGFQGSDDFLVIELSGSFDCVFACERATCAGPELEPQDTLDVVEHGFPRPNEQWLARNEVVEHGLPQAVENGFVVERELPENEDDTMVERGLPHAVEDELPRVVEQELPEEIDAVESSIPYPDADPTNRCRESANMIKRISHRLPRRVLRVRFVVVVDESRIDLAHHPSV
ncbi:hypothetical protein PC110_g21220 [Phytophthora cactorum]|uniref:Uncharacterized protein n=1 Tax=Phytophthora cactorum TaxID=29920 RepID=A0A329RGC7_9STRA|nr:hypothetical protein PC110_g21220 [Phytophthora cactorum]